MRILLLAHNYEPEIGAPQQRWSTLVSRFRAAGHDVSVVTPPPHYPSGRLSDPSGALRPGVVHQGSHGETVHRVRFRPYSTGLKSRMADQVVSAADTARVVLARFRSERPDVIIATAPAVPTVAAGGLVASALRVPLVTEMRDAWPDLLTVADDWHGRKSAPRPAGLTGVLRPHVMSAAGFVTSSTQQRSAAVVTTTETFAEALRLRGIRRVHVVRNGAHPVPGYPVHTRRAPDGELRVLYLGTIGRAQGLGSAIVAARRTHAEGVRIRFRIVGAGAEADAIRKMAAKGEVDIEVVDQVPKEGVAEHYAWADTVLVHLRPWPALELTVPSKLYEAMAIGIHVTGAVAGEAEHLLRETGAGTVVPPGDADALAKTWRHLAEDPTLLDVGQAGRRWTQQHADDDQLAERYLSILHGVLADA